MAVSREFVEVNLVTAALYTNFETRVDDDTGIEPIDRYVSGPRSGRLMLTFERL